ncbi:MAG: DUF2108 domain-containing protein [Methanomicrobiales archaeon]
MDVMTLALAAVALLGTGAVAVSRSPFDKVIGLGLLAGGVIPFVVMQGYLDVAIAVALIAPVTSLFLLMVIGRENR